MALTAGARIGPFLVKSSLGEGGMGVVFRALDTKLQRDVALKLLPDHFADDPERLARFQREAQVLASLNHPNIAQIYGLEESDNTRCIVMELVEGETLQERLKRGPIPTDEALPIAKQVAEALEAAHERGIVHRDLKPGNIKLTLDGKVKVLDFGLAKAFHEQRATTLSNSPTLVDASVPGVILGTAGYMSPEQAKGKEADRSSDVWAFGCVLYEMLTGRPVFEGETLGEILGAVFKSEPDWTRLPAATPAAVRRLLMRCLQKDRRLRLHDVADVWIEIDEAQRGIERGDNPVHTQARSPSKVLTGVLVALLLMTILSLGAFSFLYFMRPAPPEIRVEVNTPSTTDPFSFAISPDGRRLVFLATNEGKSQLWVRQLNSLAAQPLPGTDRAVYPFWSPDSASIGFFSDGKLKRTDIIGGVPQVLANVTNGRGGAWNREGTILFTPAFDSPLFKVTAGGGEPQALTRLETGQKSHRFPQFPPDGRHFIYFVQGGSAQGVYAASLDGGSPKRLVTADTAASISPSGFLLFLRQATLFAQALDFKRQELSGNTLPVAEQVALDAEVTNVAGLSVTSGIVAYRVTSAGQARQLMWLDRSGKTVSAIGSPEATGLVDVQLSPDGNRVAVRRAVNGNTDLWLIDALRGIPTRFTFDAALDFVPVWSPDGNRVAFTSTRKDGVYNLYVKASSGAGADELLLESDQTKTATDWSSDGRFLLFNSVDPQTDNDLWILPMSGAGEAQGRKAAAVNNASPTGRSDQKTAGDKKPFPFLKTPFSERDAQFSPDGHWIAYQSNESGRYEIYVQPFPGPGGKFQISNNGGAQPRWNKNGKEIFYISLDSKMLAVSVKLSPDGQSLVAGTPAALFPIRIAGGPLRNRLGATPSQQYAVSSDGQRFLVNQPVDDEGVVSPITLILNWKAKP